MNSVLEKTAASDIRPEWKIYIVIIGIDIVHDRNCSMKRVCMSVNYVAYTKRSDNVCEALFIILSTTDLHTCITVSIKVSSLHKWFL